MNTFLSSIGIENVRINQMKKNNIEIPIEDLFKSFFIESLDAIIFWNENMSVINANDAACRLFECSLDILKQYPIDAFVYEKDEKYHAIIQDLNRRGSVRDELLFQMYNGQMKYLEFSTKLYVVDGYHMTIFRNVTERYQMEKKLRESEQKFRKIFEGSLDGMLLWDENQRIIDVNPAGEKYLKVSKYEVVGKTMRDLLINCHFPDDELNEVMKNLMIEGHATGTITLTTRSGKTLHYEYSTKQNVVSNLSLTTFRDVTEKLEMEANLHKSDTLSVIGQLAAGVAHEIRNPMTALKGFIQLLEDSSEGKHSMYFDVISTELNRIDAIINEFLILAKPQAIKFVEHSITQIMSETVNLLGAQAVLYNVQFLLHYDDDLPSLICEPNQLKKVFINMIKNGIEVMPSGGFITITMNQTTDNRIHISIKDEGYGIPEEKLKKLGQPFYTTKERGTGLGLMVSYRIIEEHEGTIKVESEVGKGTVFHVYLPVGK
ncbi:histidine kinase with cyclic nucleotide-binding domain [Mycobacteroides abscessus subsp. abscessus]|nr:histidine kinase with cyclic nucleotide-binding domain [Mycobacteroides abscessus subsp. abscessus]